MDKRFDLILNTRDRDEKVYTQKAEVKAKEMQELTGSPSIDPLSRKMAEVITQRELASLGITPEPVQKKQFFKIPDKKKKISSLPTLEKSPEGLEPVLELQMEEPVASPVTERFNSQDPIHQPAKPVLEPEPKTPDVPKERRSLDQRDEILKDAENIQAFQDELQREYPELILNEDGEGSSFHTNELNELEEACKDFELEEKKPLKNDFSIKEPPENSYNEKKNLKELDISAAKTDKETIETTKTPQKKQSIRVVKTSISSSSNLHSKKSSVFSVVNLLGNEVTANLKGKTEASTFASRTPEIVKKENFKQKNAVFLHSFKGKISKFTPRCHINLENCKSSPIYFNQLVPLGAKMKARCGITSVEGLRFFLIQEVEEPQEMKNDFFSRNSKWLMEKEKKLKNKRKELEKELISCTFDPFFKKHQKNRESEPFIYKACVPNELKKRQEKEFKVVVPRNIIQYQALSPSDQKISYNCGFNLVNIERVAKPMINYRQTNLLR
jgi:hypothetical protein